MLARGKPIGLWLQTWGLDTEAEPSESTLELRSVAIFVKPSRTDTEITSTSSTVDLLHVGSSFTPRPFHVKGIPQLLCDLS